MDVESSDDSDLETFTVQEGPDQGTSILRPTAKRKVEPPAVSRTFQADIEAAMWTAARNYQAPKLPWEKGLFARMMDPVSSGWSFDKMAHEHAVSLKLALLIFLRPKHLPVHLLLILHLQFVRMPGES